MAGARCEVDGGGVELGAHRNGAAPPLPLAGEGWGGGASTNTCANGENSPTRRALMSAATSPASGRGEVAYAVKRYFAFSARLSKNTPCSPNMFQNHQGMVTRSGRP